MDAIYRVMEALLPFEMFQYDFMKNALLAILLISPLFGLLGTMVVSNSMAFFSDALGHSAFTGIAIGVILGITDTDASMTIFAICFGLLLNRIKRRNSVSTDTVISVFASLAMAVGLMILSKNGSFSKYSALLVGDILSVTGLQLLRLLPIVAAVLVFWLFGFNKLHAVSVNQSLAKSKGIPTVMIEDIFVVLLALSVMLSIRFVGVLLINALLILPAAASRNIASNMREYHLFSILISLTAGLLGLILSFTASFAAGPMIACIAAVVFFITFAFRRFLIE